jgi:RNA-directed DNA polymerase
MTKLSQLKGAKTLPQLARVLGVKPASLSFVLYWLPDDQKYETFTVPKKGGGRRLITAPESRLKMIQTKLADLLLDIHIELESARSRVQCQLAHGFKRDFSIVTNATAHRNKRYVFNADQGLFSINQFRTSPRPFHERSQFSSGAEGCDSHCADPVP